jgi:hypothetical protein
MACSCSQFCKCAWNVSWTCRFTRLGPDSIESAVIETAEGTQIATANEKFFWVFEYIVTLHNAFLQRNPQNSLNIYELTGYRGAKIEDRGAIPSIEDVAPSLRTLLEDMQELAAPPPPAARLSPVNSHDMVWEPETGAYYNVRCSCGKTWEHIQTVPWSNADFRNSCERFERLHKIEVLLGLSNVYFSSNADKIRLPEEDIPF